MRSLKKHVATYLSLGALVFSISAMADRSRDTGYKGSHSKHNSQQRGGHSKHGHQPRKNRSYDQGRSHKHAYKSPSKKGHKRQHHKRGNKHHNNGPQGFSGDYRDNRRFDQGNRRHDYNRHNNRHNSYGHHSKRNHGHKRKHGYSRHYGYNNYDRGYISHNYYKPKRYYKKWKSRNHWYWKNKYRHFNNYQVYRDDYYRYRPLRGLGHYFDRPGYGYGHWHEGAWCASYHDEGYYRDYYSYYPYDDGWRHGDGDFGIWFNFNL